MIKFYQYGVMVAAVILFAGCAKHSYEMIEMDSHDASVADAMVTASDSALLRAATAETESMSDFKSPANQLLAYKVNMRCLVDDRLAAGNKISALAEANEGYVILLKETGITLKVPRNKAAIFQEKLSQIGKVDKRELSSEDLTANIIDVQVRLSSLQKLHANLLELLQRSNQIADSLAVERELGRVTTEIEKYQAMLKNLTGRVNYVTFVIEFYQAHPGYKTDKTVNIPADWAVDFGNLSHKFKLSSVEIDLPFEIDLPDNFVPADGWMDYAVAINADDAVIELEVNNVPKHSSLEFFGKVAKRAMEEVNNVKITNVSTGVTKENLPFVLISGEKQQDKVTYSYQLGLIMYNPSWLNWGENQIYSIEIYGPAEVMKALDGKKIVESANLSMWR